MTQKKIEKTELNIVLQKEYLIITPDNPHPIIATESVRGCYAIMIFHPTKSAVLHWDDDTRYSELEKFTNEFSGDNLTLDDCVIYLVGGWKDHAESVKTGHYIKDYFLEKNCPLNLDYFQQKNCEGPLKETGFSLVSLDARSGVIFVNDTWKDNGVNFNNTRYRGEYFQRRRSNLDLLMVTHQQLDQFPDSGSGIIERDTFFIRQSREALQLCMGAKNNNIDLVIKYIDEGITNVNVSPQGAKGWTPLHYACRMGHYNIARLLLNNGADLYQKNDAGHTAYDLIKVEHQFTKRQLKDLFQLLKMNRADAPTSLIHFSIFSRHPEQIGPEAQQKSLFINKLLETDEGLNQLEKLMA